MGGYDELSCQPKKDYSMGLGLGRIRKLKILTDCPHWQQIDYAMPRYVGVGKSKKNKPERSTTDCRQSQHPTTSSTPIWVSSMVLPTLHP
jgi:hypothetical protein